MAKIVLTKQQADLRRAFRELTLDHIFNHPNTKTMMWGVVKELAEKFSISQYEVYKVLLSIPSIGYVSGNMANTVFMAKYFKPVSNAIWDGKSVEFCLELWKNTKRTTDTSPRRTRREHNEYNSLSYLAKTMSTKKEFNSNRIIGAAHTQWNHCK